MHAVLSAVKHVLWKSKLQTVWSYCASRLNVTPVFAVYSLMVISIEKEITEMNLDIDSVIRLFFSLKYDLFQKLELERISACFCSST